MLQNETNRKSENHTIDTHITSASKEVGFKFYSLELLSTVRSQCTQIRCRRRLHPQRWPGHSHRTLQDCTGMPPRLPFTLSTSSAATQARVGDKFAKLRATWGSRWFDLSSHNKNGLKHIHDWCDTLESSRRIRWVSFTLLSYILRGIKHPRGVRQHPNCRLEFWH